MPRTLLARPGPSLTSPRTSSVRPPRSLTAVPAGMHSITAVFSPTNPAKFTPSTSNTVTVKF